MKPLLEVNSHKEKMKGRVLFYIFGPLFESRRDMVECDGYSGA